MLNSTKTWQEEKLNELVRDLCSVEFRVKSATRKRLEQFISDLRKKDEEELIKILPDYRMVFPEQDTGDIIKYKLGFNDGIQKIKQLIKDYYEN